MLLFFNDSTPNRAFNTTHANTMVVWPISAPTAHAADPLLAFDFDLLALPAVRGGLRPPPR